jgi:histidinol phosphatase-like enzyme
MKKMGESLNVRKALFLDRDGVINHDPGDYTKSLAEFTVLPGVIDTLKVWHDLGYFTDRGNQSRGIGEGFVRGGRCSCNASVFSRIVRASGFFHCSFLFLSTPPRLQRQMFVQEARQFDD